MGSQSQKSESPGSASLRYIDDDVYALVAISSVTRPIGLVNVVLKRSSLRNLVTSHPVCTPVLYWSRNRDFCLGNHCITWQLSRIQALHDITHGTHIVVSVVPDDLSGKTHEDELNVLKRRFDSLRFQVMALPSCGSLVFGAPIPKARFSSQERSPSDDQPIG